MRYGKNVLVTGATSGIGLAVTQLYASLNYHVWGLSRSGTCDTPLSEQVHLFKVDVTNQESVEQGITHVWEEAIALTNEGIGIVIHCAGFGIGGAAEDTPLSTAYSQFETNYFGVLRVNQVLLPLMRTLKRSLIVVLGSIAGRISIPFQSHYSATKFALEAYIEALRIEGKQFGIRATIIEAGDTKTPFTAKREIALPPNSPYEKQAHLSIEKMAYDEQHGYSPSKVAKAILAISKKKSPPVRKPVGLSYALLMILKRVLPDRLAESVITTMYMKKK